MSKSLSKSAWAKPIHFDDAFITSIVPYGEADCIVRLFTKEGGRMAAYSKRGLLGKRGNSVVQAPALARVGIVDKANQLSRLVSCDIDPKTLKLLTSVRTFGYCAYFAEVIEKFLPEAEPTHDAFSLLEEAFLSLESCGAQAVILRSFELRTLAICGYLPELPSLDLENRIVAFDPEASRFLTETKKGSIAFSPCAVKLAKALVIAKIGTVNYDHHHELLMLGRIFLSRLKIMGLGPLRSAAFLRRLSKVSSF